MVQTPIVCSKQNQPRQKMCEIWKRTHKHNLFGKRNKRLTATVRTYKGFCCLVRSTINHAEWESMCNVSKFNANVVMCFVNSASASLAEEWRTTRRICQATKIETVFGRVPGQQTHKQRKMEKWLAALVMPLTPALHSCNAWQNFAYRTHIRWCWTVYFTLPASANYMIKCIFTPPLSLPFSSFPFLCLFVNLKKTHIQFINNWWKWSWTKKLTAKPATAVVIRQFRLPSRFLLSRLLVFFLNHWHTILLSECRRLHIHTRSKIVVYA